MKNLKAPPGVIPKKTFDTFIRNAAVSSGGISLVFFYKNRKKALLRAMKRHDRMGLPFPPVWSGEFIEINKVLKNC